MRLMLLACCIAALIQPTTARSGTSCPNPALDIGALVAQLTDRQSRAEARDVIQSLGTSATPDLLPYFEDARFTVRWEMVNIQGQVKDPRALPAVAERVLADESPHVRWRALWALALQPLGQRERAIGLLEDALENGGHERSWNAAVGLAHFRESSALERIHAGLQDSDSWRRWEAIHALQRIHDETSSERLLSLFRHAKGRERREILMSLGHLGDASAAQLLHDTLSDTDPQLRWRACQALGRAGVVSALPELRRLSQEDPAETVRLQAGRAVEQLVRRAATAKHQGAVDEGRAESR